MYRKLSILIILVFILSVVLIACNQTGDSDWKDVDINGYYKGGIESPYFNHFYSLELIDNDMNNKSKTFVIRFTEDGDSDSEHEFYIGYGYYSIDTIHKDDDYIEYVLNLNYINDVECSSFYNTITIHVKPDSVYSYVGNNKVILQK